MANHEDLAQIHVDENSDEVEKNSEKTKERKKSNFQKYAENNSVGGLSFVLTSSSKIRRVLWLAIILICVTISLYLLRNSFSKIINRPTSTTITSDPNLSLDFPAVTICNVNIFSAEKLIKNGISVGDVTEAYNDPDKCQYLNGLNFTISDLINTTVSRFITFCNFGEYPCSDEDFVFTLNQLNACFTFNSGTKKPILKVNGTGVRQGLELTLDIFQDDYVGTMNEDAGVKITVHPQGEPPLPNDLGLAAAPGTNAFIGFRKKVFDDQTERECLAQSDRKWKHLSEAVSYSYAGCQEDSFTDILLNECSCVLSTDYLPQATLHKVCELPDLCCYLSQYYNTHGETCRPSCKRDVFEIVSATYTQFPARYSQNSTEQRKFAQENTILANIYYENLNVQTQTTVYSYGVEEFFAEIGGQLGLFIGVSVITLFEFVVFLLDEIKDRWIKPRWKTKRALQS